MIRVETKKITNTHTHGLMSFNKNHLKECGMPAGAEYVVVYDNGIITIAKELKSVEVKVVPIEPFEIGKEK